MKSSPARIVLIVSGLNEISKDFHNFPAKPVGIIVIKNRSSKNALFDWRDACKSYCTRHQFKYASVTRTSLADIGDQLRNWDADLVITHSVPVLPMSVLESLSYGAMNVHHSSLPLYRGGNPLLWQVMDGVDEIGVSVHRLSADADEGDVFRQTSFTRPTAVSKRTLARTANSQHGLPLLKTVISDYLEGRLEATPQSLRSPKNSANHFPLARLSVIVSLRDVPLSGLWDIAWFFGYWPEQSTPSRGWQSWFRWRPITIKPKCQANHREPKQAAYCFDAVGIHLHLRHADGCIIFSPKLHLPTFLARLILRQ